MFIIFLLGLFIHFKEDNIMKLIYVLFLFAVIVGCNATEEVIEKRGPELIGYVVKKKVDSILVISVKPIRDNNYEAVWVRTLDNFSIGQMVEVYFKESEIATSYPGQGTAEKIDTKKIETSGEPSHTAEDVLSEALLQVEEWDIPVIKELKYIPDDQKWSIRLGNDVTKEEKQIWIDN